MRLLFLILLFLTLSIQYPLWWGKGGWTRVQELQAKVASQKEFNEALQARNNALAAEVMDLKTGTQAIEERARAEQGMLKDGEIFVQILSLDNQTQQSTTPQAGSSGSITGIVESKPSP